MATKLHVYVKDPNKNSLVSSVEVSWRLITEKVEKNGVRVGQQYILLDNVPEDKEFVLKLKRQVKSQTSTIEVTPIEVTLNLGSKPPKRRFVYGQPDMMIFEDQKAQRGGSKSRSNYKLDVTWHEPQEVVICSGENTHNRRSPFSPFFPRAISRFWHMCKRGTMGKGGVVRVNPSCVLTIFEFNGTNSRLYHMLPGIVTEKVSISKTLKKIPGNVKTPIRAVFMNSSKIPPRPNNKNMKGYVGIMDVYIYLAQAGRLRPGTVMSLEFLGHAYWIGPALENTFRPIPKREAYCFDQCPTQGAHGAKWLDLPPQLQYFLYDIDYDNEEDYLYPQKKRGDSYPSSRILLVQRGKIQPPFSMPHMSRVNQQVQNNDKEPVPEDLDPRNTDFTVLRKENVTNIKKAFSNDSIIRVWGCNNSNIGPRWRRIAGLKLDEGPDNRLITVESRYHPRFPTRKGRANIKQIWKIRRGDISLIFLSQARRSYAQAIADATGRACYAAVPGTWSEYKSKPTLGGMRINKETKDVMRRFASKQLDAVEDEAGFYPFKPNHPKKPVTIKVLITGFAPFGGESRNASTEAVSILKESEVLSSIDIPPWLNLNFDMKKVTDVDVVWTCKAPMAEPLLPERTDAPPVKGGLGILQKIKDKDIDPSIVIIVGESSNVSKAFAHMKIEQFANNHGNSQDDDNNGNRLKQDGQIFPGHRATLETILPRRTWANITRVLLQDGLGLVIPKVDPKKISYDSDGNTIISENISGDFICNESFYQLLLESTVGNYPNKGDHPSGRWVTMVHVGAYRDDNTLKSISRGLGLVVRTIVEDMLWATEIYGIKAELRKVPRI